MAARQALCDAANAGGLAINHCSAGYTHSFAHVLGAAYHIPHGAAIAMALPYIMEYNRHASGARLAKLAKYCGFAPLNAPDHAAVDSMISAVLALIADCRITDYTDRMRPEDYPHLVCNIFKDSIEMTPPKVMRKKECVAYLARIRTNAMYSSRTSA